MTSPQDFAELLRLSSFERYQEFVAKAKLPEIYEAIEGAYLMYFGELSAETLIITIPGGGLIMPVSQLQLQFTYQCFEDLQSRRNDVAICIVAYDVVPAKPYPTAIRQVVAAVDHLLKTRNPESINFVGDSMGASLSMAALLHYSGHTHPNVPPASLPKGRKFGSCALLSIASPYPSDTKSMQDPETKDILNKDTAAALWAVTANNCEQGVSVPNNWINSQFAPEEWFKDLPVSAISVVYGGLEIFADDIDVIADSLQKSYNGSLTIVKDPKAKHGQFLIEMQGEPRTSDYTSAIYAWYKLI